MIAWATLVAGVVFGALAIALWVDGDRNGWSDEHVVQGATCTTFGLLFGAVGLIALVSP